MSFYSNGTAGTIGIVCSTITVVPDWDWYFRPATRGPQYGWYREFDPWPEPELTPLPLLAERPYRAQARACIKNVRRWKRRRFLHSLRRCA